MTGQRTRVPGPIGAGKGPVPAPGGPSTVGSMSTGPITPDLAATGPAAIPATGGVDGRGHAPQPFTGGELVKVGLITWLGASVLGVGATWLLWPHASAPSYLVALVLAALWVTAKVAEEWPSSDSPLRPRARRRKALARAVAYVVLGLPVMTGLSRVLGWPQDGYFMLLILLGLVLGALTDYLFGRRAARRRAALS